MAKEETASVGVPPTEPTTSLPISLSIENVEQPNRMTFHHQARHEASIPFTRSIDNQALTKTCSICAVNARPSFLFLYLTLWSRSRCSRPEVQYKVGIL
jgi:hypothetical protein